MQSITKNQDFDFSFFLLPWPALQAHWVLISVWLLSIIKSEASMPIFSPCLLDPSSRDLLKYKETMWSSGPASVTTCFSPFAHDLPPFSFHPKSSEVTDPWELIAFASCLSLCPGYGTVRFSCRGIFFKVIWTVLHGDEEKTRTVSMSHLVVMTVFL